MQNNFDEVLKNPAFKNIEPDKIQAIREMALKLEGKSIPEAMIVFNQYQATLAGGRTISPEERELMIAAILGAMDSESREKFVSAMKMVSMMKTK